MLNIFHKGAKCIHTEMSAKIPSIHTQKLQKLRVERWTLHTLSEFHIGGIAGLMVFACQLMLCVWFIGDKSLPLLFLATVCNLCVLN